MASHRTLILLYVCTLAALGLVASAFGVVTNPDASVGGGNGRRQLTQTPPDPNFPQGIPFSYSAMTFTPKTCGLVYSSIKPVTLKGGLASQCLTGGCSVTENGESVCDNTITCQHVLNYRPAGSRTDKQIQLAITNYVLPEAGTYAETADNLPSVIVRGWISRRNKPDEMLNVIVAVLEPAK